jgi:hypothetical protein
MRRQSVPDQHNQSIQHAEELDKCFVVVGATIELKDEVGIAAVGFVRQGTGQRRSFPSEPMA